MYKMATMNQYAARPLMKGEKSSWAKPLILELIDKGQAPEVFKLLYSVNLAVKEKSSSPGFTIHQT